MIRSLVFDFDGTVVEDASPIKQQNFLSFTVHDGVREIAASVAMGGACTILEELCCAGRNCMYLKNWP